jgi:hypothetical protein
MIWAVVGFVFAQNAGRKRLTIVVFAARMKNVRNAAQSCSGRALIITSYLIKKRRKRTMNPNYRHRTDILHRLVWLISV